MNTPPHTGNIISTNNRRSLKQTLIGWFMLLTLLPMSLIAWIGYHQANIILARAVEKNLVHNAKSKVTFLRTWFDYRFMDLKNQAGNRRISAFLVRLKEGLKQSALSPAAYVKTFDWAWRTDAFQEDFITLALNYDYLYDLFLVDTEGNILYSIAGESDLGVNLFNEPLSNTRFSRSVKAALRSGQAVFSDLERYVPSNNMIAGFLSAPLTDGQGGTAGVIAFQIKLKRVFERITATKTKSKSSQVDYLVGSDGLLRTDPGNVTENILSRRVETKQLRLWLDEHGQHKKYPDDMLEKAFHYTGLNGQEVIGVHHTIHLPGGVKWALFSEINLDEALGAAWWLGAVTLALVTLTGLLSAGLAWLLVQRITRPLIQLANTSLAVAAGKTGQQVQVKANNEIGKLAEAFNYMLAVRHRHEQALEQSNRETQKALNNLAEQKFALDQHATVSITDTYGNITFVNDKFTKLSGYSHHELLGKNHRILNSGYHEAAFFQQMYKTISHGSVWHGEVCNKAKDGRLYWLDTTIVPFKGDDGKPQSYIAIRTDITERKRAEQALQDAKEAAESANRAKSEFLANMSHEIRTPMNAIIGFTELAQQTELDPEQKDYLSKINSSAYLLLNLLNDILDFSKIEAGKLAVERIQFQLKDITDNLLEIFGRMAGNKGLEFAVLLEPGIPWSLEGDPLRLRQILVNLINNAIKFTSEGEVILTISRETENNKKVPGQVRLQFSVQDTGIGLEAKQIPKLFQAFSQADGSTTRKFGGTGLGLTISKQLAELMGGTIDAKNAPEGGSIFCFAADFTSHGKKYLYRMPRHLSGMKVLVADENKYSHHIIERMLCSFGLVPVSIAPDSAMLSVSSESANVKLVILSCSPATGQEKIEALIESIGQNSRHTQTPKLIIVHGENGKKLKQALVKFPVDAFLPKPLSQSSLFTVITEIFSTGKKTTLRQKPFNPGHDKHAHPPAPDQIRGAHILLTEDNPINQQLTTEILKQAGMHVSVAGSGKEALHKLEEGNVFDAVLMDIQMPEMDGYETTLLIRKQPCHKDLPVIAITAHALKGDKEKCLAAGMNAYISKPIDVAQLFKVLKQWIKPGRRPLPPRRKGNDKTDNQLPEKLPGINISAALKRLGGNRHILKKLLMDFRRDNADSVQLIRTALDKGHMKKAKHLAHSLKGLAANLSMEKLATSAQLLEAAILEKKESTHFEALLKQAQQCLNTVLEASATLQTDSSPTIGGDNIQLANKEKLVSLLGELDAFLKQHNFEAQHHWNEIKKHLSYAEWQDEIAHLDNLIGDLKFKEARKPLTHLIKLVETSWQTDMAGDVDSTSPDIS